VLYCVSWDATQYAPGQDCRVVKKVYNPWTDFSKLSEKQKKVLEKSDKYWFDFFDRG